MEDNGVNIIRTYMRTIKRAKQLRKVDCAKVKSAGFTDDSEKCFEIEFETEDGKNMDILLMFEGRYPEMFVSDPY